MRREQIDLADERRILTNLILSTEFLKRLSIVIKPSLFQASYSRMIVNWIQEYYEHYKEAPGRNIEGIFAQKAKALDDEISDNISEFLSRLSKDADGFQIQNFDYAVDSAIKYLKLRSLEYLSQQLQSVVLEADPVKGEQLIANYSRVQPPTGEGVEIFKDTEPIILAFLTDDEILFSFPGALGKVVGPFLRGDLVSFQGAMKRGKTWWLIYAGMEAALAGKKVVFFTLEMPERQILRRFWMSLCGQPKRGTEVRIPYFKDKTIDWKIESRMPVDTSEISRKQRQFKTLYKAGAIKILSLPAYSCTMQDIEAILDNLQYYDSFMPDVAIIDYFDIMGSESKRLSPRDQLDDIWKNGKRIAMSRNILMATATQSGRATLSRDGKEDDVAEDIRKLAHVSKMIVINRTIKEYEQGIVRISQAAERDERMSTDQAVVLQCLDIGRPYLDSKFKRELRLVEDEDK
jgi:replicative DNA helicase